MQIDIATLVRENIKALLPYSSARAEFTGTDGIFLNANENSFGSPLTKPYISKPYNRYPDPSQTELKKKIGVLNRIDSERIFLGNGSDEAIDLIFRCFCEPSRDNVIICPPTYAMYEVSATINAVEVKRFPQTAEFQLDVEGILQGYDRYTKAIFVCSPNNPTGNTVVRKDLLRLIKHFPGIVVIDEAYIQYSTEPSMIDELREHNNIIVLQTLSKAWGLAGLRVGMAFAHEEIIRQMSKVKPPYNINAVAQDIALAALENSHLIDEWIAYTIQERNRMKSQLETFSLVERVYSSDANFLLVRVQNAKRIYKYLLDHKIIVRDRSNLTLCDGCLRITIGTQSENDSLIRALWGYNA